MASFFAPAALATCSDARWSFPLSRRYDAAAMPAFGKSPPRGTRGSSTDPREAPKRFEGRRSCDVCGTRLSAYNEGPGCWRHSVVAPWRGPSGKPKLD